MAKVPTVGEFTIDQIREAVISTGGSVPATDYTWDTLVEQSNFADFDPAYLDGATSKAGINNVFQFRGYPRDKYGNVATSDWFQKSCSNGGEGSWHQYSVPANTYFSYDGQAAANALASADVAANGQNYVNALGEGYCTWYSDEFTGTYSKEGCGYRGVGSSITHTIPAGAKSSTISKQNANDLAVAEMNSVGQAGANSNGYCTWYSEYRADNIQKNDCGSGTGSYVWVEALENAFSSTSSLSNANAQRDSWMQGQANANGSCTSAEIPFPSLTLEGWVFNPPGFGGYEATIKIAGKPSDPTIEIARSYAVSTGASMVYGNISGPNVDGSYTLKVGLSGHSTGTLSVIFFRTGEPGSKTSTIFLNTADA